MSRGLGDVYKRQELTSGDTNTEIAKKLYIAPGTVKNYIQYMLEKTGYGNRTELAIEARVSGIVIAMEE